MDVLQNLLLAFASGARVTRTEGISEDTKQLWVQLETTLAEKSVILNLTSPNQINPEKLFELLDKHNALQDPKILAAVDRYLSALKQDAPLYYQQSAQKIINIEHNYAPIYIQTVPERTLLSKLRSPIPDFVGRSDYLDTVSQILRSSLNIAPVVSLHGMGGIGKTEFAYKVAEQVADVFTDGQVALSVYGSTDRPLTAIQILQRIIRAFDETAATLDEPDNLQRVYHSLLAGKRVLLILDDVRDATQLVPLVPPAGCALLITSRIRFAIPGMTEIEIPILSPEDAHTFLEHLAPRARGYISILTQLCGNLPLALRVVGGVLNKTTRPIEHFIDGLRKERTRLAHMQDDAAHLDMDASLNVSYRLLDLPTQRIFTQLGVFSPSFEFSAADTIVSLPKTIDLYRVLDQLYERHLLQYDAEYQRYSLHELIRVYAIQKLKKPIVVQQRYIQYYLQLVKQLEPYLTTGEQQRALDHLELEHDHIRAALALADRHHHHETICDYASHLWRFWENRGYFTEAHGWLTKSTTLTSTDIANPAILANAYIGLGSLEKARGHLEAAHSSFAHSLTIWQTLDDARGVARTLNNLGQIALLQNDLGLAHQYFVDSLSRFKALEDQWGSGIVLCHLGMVAHEQEQFAVAGQYYQEGLQYLRRSGDKVGEARYLDTYAHTLRLQGDLPTARTMIEQSLRLREELDEPWGMASAHETLGLLSLAEGSPQQAVYHFTSSLDLARTLGDDEGIIWALEGLAGAAVAQGNFEIATRILNITMLQRTRLDLDLPPSEIPRYQALYTELNLPWPPEHSTASTMNQTDILSDDLLDSIVAETARWTA